MPLTCNIDARGKWVRLIYGTALLLAGILLAIFWARPAGGWVAWTVSIAIAAAGVFAIFESRSGWCIVRAMGFRTPI